MRRAIQRACILWLLSQPAWGEDHPVLAKDSVAMACARAVQAAQQPIHLVEDELLARLCAAEGRPPELQPEAYEEASQYFHGEGFLNAWVPRGEVSSARLDSLLERAPERDSLFLAVSPDKQALFPSLMQDKPILGAGPLMRLREDTHAREGHYGATTLALRAVNSAEPTEDPAIQGRRTLAFPYPVHELIRDASQQPDFYEWNNPAAHAQTPCTEEEDGRAFNTCARSDTDPAHASACALEAFIDWERMNARAMRKACELGLGDVVFYRVGYALHGLQDFAAHKGRTNAEHSWEAMYSTSPDEKSTSFALALDLSERYLVAVGELLLKHCPRAAGTVTRPRRGLSRAMKVRVHPNGWDLSIGSYLRYRALGEKYKKLVMAREERPIRWFATPDHVFDWQGPEPEVCSQDARCEEIFQRILTVTSAELTPGP